MEIYRRHSKESQELQFPINKLSSSKAKISQPYHQTKVQSGKYARMSILKPSTTTLVILLSGCCCVAFNVLGAQRENQRKSADQQQQQQLPDSVYKNAPLLFGADIIDDYYTEPAEQAPASTPLTTTTKRPLPVPTTTRRARSNEKGTRVDGHSSKNPSRLKRVAANEPAHSSSLSSAAMQEAAAGALRDMAKSGGVSMDHVISSLGLVVEAMKQQTMAMQMISGQMVASSVKATRPTLTESPSFWPPPPPVQPGDIRALLESFGEMIGSLTGGVKGGAAPIGSASSDPVKGVNTHTRPPPVQAQIPDEPVQLITERANTNLPSQEMLAHVQVQEAPAPIVTSSSPSSTTTTTTTTTTTLPTSTTTTPVPTTTTTTARPTTPTSTTTTSTTTVRPTESSTVSHFELPHIPMKQKIMPVELITASPYVNGKDWRRLVPFDYYPFTQTSEQQQAAAMSVPSSSSIGSVNGNGNGNGGEGGSESGGGFEDLTDSHLTKQMQMNFSPMLMTGADSYRSVGMPSYSASASSSSPTQAQQQQQSLMVMMNQQPAQIQHIQLQPMTIAQMQPQYHSIKMMQPYAGQQQQQRQKMLMRVPSVSPNNQQLMGDSAGGSHFSSFGMIPLEHVVSSTQAPVLVPLQHQSQQQLTSQTGKMALAVALAEQMQHLKEQQQQQQQQVEMQLQMQQMIEDVSDEIPKVPSPNAGAQFLMSARKIIPKAGAPSASSSQQQQQQQQQTLTNGGIKSSIKIGERPQFDTSNFQILDSSAVSQQQHKQTMQMLQQVLEAAQEHQKQQQQQQQEPQATSGDLNANASSQSNELVKTNSKIKENERPLKGTGGGGTLMIKQQPPPPPKGGTSFSILGGRFKITPHTQMLHYLLEPSKVLLQQAFNQLMPTSGSQLVITDQPPQVPHRKLYKQQQPAKTTGKRRGNKKQSSKQSSSSSSSSLKKAPKSLKQ